MKKALYSNKHRCVRGLGILLIMAILVAGMPGCRLQLIDPIEIRTWYDLHAIRDDIDAHYILMNDLDSTTEGYTELAGPTADGGQGWLPIRSSTGMVYPWFNGVFEGQGYEIRDLFINRPYTNKVGLFEHIYLFAEIRNLGVVDADVTGNRHVGGLVGMVWRQGSHHGVSDCYFSGSVTGNENVGGLVGTNHQSSISNCYSTGSVTGGDYVGGLVGDNREDGIVDNSYATGSVTGNEIVGGLVGHISGTVTNSHATGSVTGDWRVGGLVGILNSYGTVSNSHATGAVTGGDGVGGLVGDNDGTVENSHATGSVTAYRSVGGLVGYSGGTVSDSHATGSVTGDEQVGGLVGSNWGTVTNSYAASSVTGSSWVGGLVGWNSGNVTDSYSSGSVTGGDEVGGLVGYNRDGVVSNSHYDYSEVLINGENVITIGALYHDDFEQWLANGRFLDVTDRLDQEDDYYVINDVSDLKQLLAFGQDESLRFRLKDDIDLGADPGFYIPYLAGEFDGNGHRISNLSFNSDFISGVGLFGHLVWPGTVSDLGVENVNIRGAARVGGLVGLSGGIVSNSYATGNMTGGDEVGGLVGYSSRHGTVRNSHATANVTGGAGSGGLVGSNWGTVSDCYATGSVTGDWNVGGLVGSNRENGTVSNSYATGSVTGEWAVGGLVGWNHKGSVSNSHATGNVTADRSVGGLVGLHGWPGTVSNSYATGSVTGTKRVGGLVGRSSGTVSNSYATGSVTGDEYVGGLVGEVYDASDVTASFWDTQTSGQGTSAGGTGKSTAEMKAFSTFDAALWDIVLIGAYFNETWYIDNGNDYPRLGWQPVS